MNDMIRYYACQIVQVFYLKENQELTREQKKEIVCEILEEIRLQQAKALKRKILKYVKKMLKIC